MPSKYQPIPKKAIKVPLPDILQKELYSCGAAAVMSISRYFGQGPEYEEDLIDMLKKLGMKSSVGAHPHQIRRLTHKLGLKTKEYAPMKISQLKSSLKKGRPVLMMIQAYGEDKKNNRLKSYKDVWSEGHWIVAIGYDKDCVFFEDPSLEGIRGYIPYKELEERWHDVGPYGRHISRYGLVIWKQKRHRSRGYLTSAQYIE